MNKRNGELGVTVIEMIVQKSVDKEEYLPIMKSFVVFWKSYVTDDTSVCIIKIVDSCVVTYQATQEVKKRYPRKKKTF